MEQGLAVTTPSPECQCATLKKSDMKRVMVVCAAPRCVMAEIMCETFADHARYRGLTTSPRHMIRQPRAPPGRTCAPSIDLLQAHGCAHRDVHLCGGTVRRLETRAALLSEKSHFPLSLLRSYRAHRPVCMSAWRVVAFEMIGRELVWLDGPLLS